MIFKEDYQEPTILQDNRISIGYGDGATITSGNGGNTGYGFGSGHSAKSDGEANEVGEGYDF